MMWVLQSSPWLWLAFVCLSGCESLQLYFAVQVKSLENDNELLERNEKDLKENMERLLQSREEFMKQYDACAFFLWAAAIYSCVHYVPCMDFCRCNMYINFVCTKSIGLSSKLFMRANWHLAHDRVWLAGRTLHVLCNGPSRWRISRLLWFQRSWIRIWLYLIQQERFASVTQVLGDVECLVGEKENVGMNANGTLLLVVLFDQSSAVLVH